MKTEIINYLKRNFNIEEVVSINDNFIQGDPSYTVTYRTESGIDTILVKCSDLVRGHPRRYETKQIGAIINE